MDEEQVREWEAINAAMELEDAQRERVIKEMRETQKSSKAAIYALHRGDVATARAKLGQALRVAQTIQPIITANPALRFGTFSNAIEEYVEAQAFMAFLETGKLIRLSAFDGLCTHEEFLGGVSDLTGEMQRYAVIRATSRDVAAVRRCRDLTDAIMSAMMNFNLRNGNLRKKTDAIKYSLKRFEDILYELSLVPDNRKIDAELFNGRKDSEPDVKRARGTDDEQAADAAP